MRRADLLPGYEQMCTILLAGPGVGARECDRLTRNRTGSLAINIQSVANAGMAGHSFDCQSRSD